MTIQEKLKFLEDNKDTLEVKYPRVKKLFHDIENYQEEKVFSIWMEKIAEPISVRIDYIKEYCDKEEKKEKRKRGKCDFMIALYTIYKKITEKPYLCHCDTNSCYIRKNSFNERTILEYEYYSRTSLHSLFWGYRSFPSDNNLEEENNRYKTCLEQMFKHLDTLGNSFNYRNAIFSGFYDFDSTPVKDIIKSDYDCAYLYNLISNIAKERQDNSESYISDILNNPIVKENFHTGFYELDNKFYIPFDINNKTTQTQTEIKEPTNENNTKEEKKQFSTKYTHDELNKIFRKSMDKGLFKDDTKLEDFLYVFGGGIKPKNFNKLDWIITAKSKSVNKRLLIYYFMKIYNLKRDYVRSPFIQFINERVKAGDKIIELRSKADFEYIPEELKGIFPE